MGKKNDEMDNGKNIGFEYQLEYQSEYQLEYQLRAHNVPFLLPIFQFPPEMMFLRSPESEKRKKKVFRKGCEQNLSGKI